MPFIIMMSHEPKAPKPKWESIGLIFETGQEASEYCKNENSFNNIYGFPTRFRVKAIPMEDPLAWRIRERAKLDNGEHQRPPWGDMNTDLFEHIDPDDPTKVRFFISEQDAWRERYTSMSPGKFIRSYLDSYTPDYQIDEWCAAMGLDMTVSKLKLARSPKDIVRVYTEGPHSCMSYKVSGDSPYYIKNVHPVEVYGDSDLAVAYITRIGDVTARCLVWPDKKIHGRIYGDQARMRERLKEEGYMEDWEGFVGAKLRLLYAPSRGYNKSLQIVAPYFDGECGAVIENDKLVISNKPHLILKSPYGVVEADSCTWCGRSETPLEIIRNEDGEMTDFVCMEGCNN